MTVITLETTIHATAEQCFNISRSVDAHLISMQHTDERIIEGRRIGYFELGDTVTWEAVHFGIRQQLTVEITKLEYPLFFEDRMVRGAFTSMRHEHHFLQTDNSTLMKDLFCYETPYGFFGKLFNWLVLKHYMTNLLRRRNETIRMQAEAAAA